MNENSIVLRMSYMTREGTRFRAMFMGDAGEAAEARLLGRGIDLHAVLSLCTFIAANYRKSVKLSRKRSNMGRE